MRRHLGTYKIIDAKSAQDSVGLLPNSLVELTENYRFYIVWSPGTSAGAVSFEGAHNPNYAGAWSTIVTSSFSAADAVIIQASANNMFGVALRARISTAIVGGTVDVIVCMS